MPETLLDSGDVTEQDLGSPLIGFLPGYREKQ